MKFKLNDIKIGDTLICVKPCIMAVTKIQATTIHKKYTVIAIRSGFRDFEIINDLKETHYFEIINDLKETHYFDTNGKYLIPLKRLRLEKIKKLNL